jgi:hypothetical protein
LESECWRRRNVVKPQTLLAMHMTKKRVVMEEPAPSLPFLGLRVIEKGSSCDPLVLGEEHWVVGARV